MNSDEHDEVIGDVHVCGNCRGEFVFFADFVKHKQSCIKKQVVMIFNDGQEQMEESSRMSEKEQDTTSERSMTPEDRKSVEPNYVSEGKVAQQQEEQPGRSSDQSPNPSLPPSNVSLDNLENTPYAVAQFPRESAMIPGHPDVVMIQEQLYALQQQHIHQLHMIQSIQHQINHLTAQQQRQNIQHQQLQQLQQQNQQKQEPKDSIDSTDSNKDSPGPDEKTVETKVEPLASSSDTSTATTSSIPSTPIVPIPTIPGMIQPPHILSPAGAAAASAVQQSAIEAMHAHGRLLPPLPPPFHIPNQKSPFELLQQHANRLIPHNPLGIPPPLPYHESLLSSQPKSKPPNVSVFDPKFSADDPFFRHKCRFCHKVFGSDSALQIHIRSHTGERPYKCNICGNRFSTKGNLKVHFQRHQSRYPHVHMDVRHHPPTPPLMDQPLQPPSIHQIPMPTIPNDHAKFPHDEDTFPRQPSKSISPGESEGSMGEGSRPQQDEDQSDVRHSSSKDKSQGGDERDSPSTSQGESLSPNERRLNLSTSPSMALSSNVFPALSVGGIPMSAGYPLPYAGFPRATFGQNGAMPFESSKSAVEQDQAMKPETPPSLANLAEAGMRASETSKLQQLVENIEQKITDPNQCVICHRVLSCKSSLQLHYRTHTGERPFNCKICGRSFTTKGNLKTHYAVHRSKGPVRALHDCPICEKRFSNPLVLQQHLRLHAAEGMTIPPHFEHPKFDEMKSEGDDIEKMEELGDENHMDVDERNDLPTPEEGEVPDDSFPDGDKPEDGTLPADVNSPPVENHISEDEDKETGGPLQGRPFMPGVLGLQPASSMANGDSSTAPSPGHSADTKSMMSEDENRNLNMYNHHRPESITSSMAEDEDLKIDENDTDMNGALDLRPKGTQENIPPRDGELPAYYPRDGPFMEDIKPTMSSAGLLMSVPNMQLGTRRPVRPNTTCHYCGKVFACTSALNIHYRSHTKERPFRCDVCSKGFSTKGNLKQHMLTHKIRDMPMPRYDSPNGQSNGLPSLPAHSVSPVIPRPVSQELPLQQTSTTTNSQTPPLKRSLSVSPEDSNKRTAQFKHSCSVCGKQFQTNSALEIHMRTHTGEKPFRCHICSRAFTTKGNLKVHLGTHMWNGGGRRGRRIAVEPPFIVSPKEGEVFRGDMFGMHPGFAEGAFYHYPPPHLLNGFAAAAANSKANEISVIQQPTSLHPQDPGSVIMRNSLAPSADSRDAAYSREVDRHREMLLSRDEALNHEIALNREEVLSREMAINREEALSRERALNREEALSRERALNREEVLSRERALSRGEALSREMALNREEALSRERALNREEALSQAHEIALKREEALSREMAVSREEALNREIALTREEAFSREMALKRELAQNKEIALERSNDRTPPMAPQISS